MSAPVWTEAMDAALAQAIEAGHSARDAAEAVSALGHAVTRNAVLGRALRRGLHGFRGVSGPIGTREPRPAGAAPVARAVPRPAPAPRPKASPRERAPRPAPVVARPSAPRIGPATVGRPLDALRDGVCRFPVADEIDDETGRAAFLFCLAPAASSSPWCAGHRMICVTGGSAWIR